MLILQSGAERKETTRSKGGAARKNQSPLRKMVAYNGIALLIVAVSAGWQSSPDKAPLPEKGLAASSPDVVMTTSYEPMIAAAEGEMPMDSYLKNHVQVVTQTPGKDIELMTLLGAAMTLFAHES